ncbi:hypothetical protein CK214_13945 [Mesorhizobium sp. WSM3882]|nr:hypothetical protein CK214_13945 [Mesorhizobium sp. WSM3882]
MGRRDLHKDFANIRKKTSRSAEQASLNAVRCDVASAIAVALGDSSASEPDRKPSLRKASRELPRNEWNITPRCAMTTSKHISTFDLDQLREAFKQLTREQGITAEERDVYAQLFLKQTCAPVFPLGPERRPIQAWS